MMDDYLVKIKRTIRNILIQGKGPQNFLGAFWLRAALKLTPRFKKEEVALRVLALSPHYFYRDAEKYGPEVSRVRFLELERQRNESSRQQICDQILRPHLSRKDTVLD